MRQQDEAALGFWQFDDLERDAVFGGGVGGPFAGMTLIDIGDFDMVFGDSLHGAGKPFDLATIVCAGWRNVQRKQVPQRIDGYVDLRALLAPVTVIARKLAALRR